jgi:putative flippase GtrA
MHPPPSLLGRLLDAWHRRTVVLKMASFAAVGVVNSVVDFVVFWMGVQYLDLPLVPANMLSWLVAVSNSYALNTLVTFANESNRALRWNTYAKFLVSGLAGLVVNTSVLVAAVNAMPAFIDDPTLQLAAAKACAIAASFLVNFSLSYFVVFRKQRGA